MRLPDDMETRMMGRLSRGELSRREFMKFCTGVAITLGLPASMGATIAEALESPKRPPVIWLSGQQCSGCTETLLRANHPKLDTLILDLISLDYHETLSTPAGKQAEDTKMKSMKANKGKFVLVFDGSIPTKDNGIYAKIGGRTVLEIVKEAAGMAGAVIAIGSCASWGGIPSAKPNPTGAVGLPEVLKGMPVVTIPGCPPNPYNFLSTVVHFLTFKKLPELDGKGRPKFAYGRIIHENCERRAHFDAGRFAHEFGDEGHKKGFCLYKLGCKGPETFANCPAILFGDTGSGSWPVGTGHPCFGCTEQGVGFEKPMHSNATLRYVTPPSAYSDVNAPKGTGVTIGSAVLAAAAAGAAYGAGKKLADKLGKEDKESGSSKSKES